MCTTSHPDKGIGDGSGASNLESEFWPFVLKKSEKHDKELAETWKSDADGILIFTGLFSAIVTAFIVESYKRLQPDPGDTTNFILSQISQQLAPSLNGTQAPAVTRPPPFHASPASIRFNILFFLSLCLSLTCALLATLMQQWSRNY
ncbi:hypothetical protein BC834DRAFT_823665, partial [Gloeopeniophorella convolvens]